MTNLKTEFDHLFIGFDKLFDMLPSSGQTLPTKYPPYNIIKTDKYRYTIQLAVAGFTEEQLDIELHKNVLSVKGFVSEDGPETIFIYKGIAERAFERKFTLSDTVEVDEINLVNGMLIIKLVNNLPEEKKPRKLLISGKSEPKQLLTE